MAVQTMPVSRTGHPGQRTTGTTGNLFSTRFLLTLAGMHFLPKHRWRLQTDHRHEMGAFALRHVDPRSIIGEHYISGTRARR